MMEASLGVPVLQHDDGSRPSMHDLSVLYSSEDVGAAEVVAAADGGAIALWNLLNPGGRWCVDDLAGGWAVLVEMTARGRRIRNELPSLLRLLEKNGVTSLDTRWSEGGPFHQAARALKVVHANQYETEFPGSIYPNIDFPVERLAGFTEGSSKVFVEWLADFLRSPAVADVRRKLASSGSARRHAFVFVADFAPPFGVTDQLIRDDAPLPTADLELPTEVTEAWVVSSWGSGTGFRWSEEDGWLVFDKRV
jgi:hypothetical protein